MGDGASRLSEKAAKILRLIADGCRYNQIVGRNAGLTYEDIFNAAAEALRLVEQPVGAVTQRVTGTDEPPAVSTTPIETTGWRRPYLFLIRVDLCDLRARNSDQPSAIDLPPFANAQVIVGEHLQRLRAPGYSRHHVLFLHR